MQLPHRDTPPGPPPIVLITPPTVADAPIVLHGTRHTDQVRRRLLHLVQQDVHPPRLRHDVAVEHGEVGGLASLRLIECPCPQGVEVVPAVAVVVQRHLMGTKRGLDDASHRPPPEAMPRTGEGYLTAWGIHPPYHQGTVDMVQHPVAVGFGANHIIHRLDHSRIGSRHVVNDSEPTHPQAWEVEVQIRTDGTVMVSTATAPVKVVATSAGPPRDCLPSRWCYGHHPPR